ncbi:MAG: Protein YffB [Candidatus Erwinia impunctatus]|nr:Protein YffB [Culicoides impunctatus]
MLTMYGIKNCDTIKKAQRYLDTQHVAFQFHDYRQNGLDAELLATFIKKLGWEALVNTRGTTWRKLSEETRAAITNSEAASRLMLEQPAIIKRPLLVREDGEMLLGFNEATYQTFAGVEE